MSKPISLVWRAGMMALWLALAFAPAITAGVPFSSLSAQEQQVLAPYAERWEMLSEQKQQQLQSGARAWLQMSAEERSRAQNRWVDWQQLTPDQQEQLRRRYEHFQRLSPEHRERLRQVRQEYLELPPASRERLRQDWQAVDERHREGLRERLLQAEQPGDGPRRGATSAPTKPGNSAPAATPQLQRSTPQQSDQRGRR